MDQIKSIGTFLQINDICNDNKIIAKTYIVPKPGQTLF